MKINEFMKKQGKPLKDTTKDKPTKDFANMTAAEKWALVEKLLRNLGYID